MELTRRTEIPEKNGKAHIPRKPDPDPSLSDSSSKIYNLPKDRSYSKQIKNKSDKKKESRKHKKQDASGSSSSNSESSNDSEYRRKQQKNKSHRKTDLIKLCARLTAELLTTAYK